MTRKNPPKLHIGLLTPYNGGNLGDGAIQEAVIANLRERDPGCSLHGFTLDPARTQRLHNIPCSPLTLLSVPHYRLSDSSSSAVEAGGGGENDEPLQRLKELLKRNVVIYRTLLAARRGAELASAALTEVRFLWRGCRMLKEMDLLIVSGGGQLDDYWGGPWGHPFSLFKWGLLARLTGTPYLFLSVGTCTLESRLSRLFVKRALKWASYRSYRDEGSKALLRSIPFTCADPVCPDLAFSLKIPARAASEGERRSLVVGVSPIAYLSPTWPKSDLGTYNPYHAALRAFVRQLLASGASVVLYHTDTSDSRIVKELAEDLGREVTGAGTLSVRPTATVADLLEVMAEVDLVVASRLHGVILAHLMNRPVLAISYDRKVTAYMKEVQQEQHCLDIHRLDLAALAAAFDALRSGTGEARTLIAEKAARYRSSLAAQYDAALGMAFSGRALPSAGERGRAQ